MGFELKLEGTSKSAIIICDICEKDVFNTSEAVVMWIDYSTKDDPCVIINIMHDDCAVHAKAEAASKGKQSHAMPLSTYLVKLFVEYPTNMGNLFK